MREWRQIAGLATLGTVCAIAFSLMLNYLLLLHPTLTSFSRILISAIVVPPTIALPMSLVLAFRQMEIRRLRQALTRNATYDLATSFINAKAFSSFVDRRMNVSPTGTSRPGAFLIVDIENLRLVNISHGLEWREEVLRFVASLIRASVRNEDIVGRLGETEFGILMAGATEDNARQVGERIRTRVLNNYVGTQGENAINATVGGVTFEDHIDFEVMLLAADRQLLAARQSRVIELSRQGDSFSDRRVN